MAEILSELAKRGLTVRVDGDALKLRPTEVLDAALLSRVRAHKRGNLGSLMCAASCYEIEPGTWVHHPWDGCRTVPASQPVTPVPQAECRHCDRAGLCDCPTCTLRRTEDAVPCCMCRPQEPAELACHNRSNPMLALPRHQAMPLCPLLGPQNRRVG